MNPTKTSPQPPKRAHEPFRPAPLSKDGELYLSPVTMEQWGKLYAEGARPHGYWKTHKRPPQAPASGRYE